MGHVNDVVLPREVIVVSSSEVFRPADYPWLVTLRVVLKAGDAGTPDADGETGYALLELYDQDPRVPGDGDILCTDPSCVSRRWVHSHPDGWPEHPSYKGR